MNLPLILLAVGATKHYAWSFVPPELMGMAAKGLTGASTLCLLGLLWHLVPKSKVTAFVLLWWAWEELQVVLCSAWYMVEPWTVPLGQAICSAKTGIDLGSFGIIAVALLAYHSVKSDSTSESWTSTK